MSGMEASMSGKGVDPSVPMAVFVHGGVWSSGERWQFAPLAHRLAEEGIVTGYFLPLYPPEVCQGTIGRGFESVEVCYYEREVVWGGCKQNAFGGTFGGESPLCHGFIVR